MSSEPPATLADRKVDLIACLSEAWSRGPRAKPFDPEGAWWHIELFTALIQKPPSTTSADLRAQASELVKALGDARKMLDRTKKMRPELAQELYWAWTWLATGGASAASVLSGQTPTDGLIEQLQQAVDAVSDLEAAANLVAHWHGGPRGNREGSGRLPPQYILLLAQVYTVSSGLKPTTSTHSKKPGSFVDFMLTVRNTFDIPLRDDAVHRAVKVVLRHLKTATARPH